MEALACGEVGLEIDYFYRLTPREFHNILKGYSRKQEFSFKNGWEQTRRIMHCLLLPHQKTNKRGKVIKPLKLQDVMPFTWDAEHNQPKLEVSEDEAKAFWERVDKKENNDI